MRRSFIMNSTWVVLRPSIESGLCRESRGAKKVRNIHQDFFALSIGTRALVMINLTFGATLEIGHLADDLRFFESVIIMAVSLGDFRLLGADQVFFPHPGLGKKETCSLWSNLSIAFSRHNVDHCIVPSSSSSSSSSVFQRLARKSLIVIFSSFRDATFCRVSSASFPPVHQLAPWPLRKLTTCWQTVQCILLSIVTREPLRQPMT